MCPIQLEISSDCHPCFQENQKGCRLCDAVNDSLKNTGKPAAHFLGLGFLFILDTQHITNNLSWFELINSDYGILVVPRPVFVPRETFSFAGVI